MIYQFYIFKSSQSLSLLFFDLSSLAYHSCSKTLLSLTCQLYSKNIVIIIIIKAIYLKSFYMYQSSSKACALS